jgi:hypothetical protein
MKKLRWLCLALFVLLWLSRPAPARAHWGAPYPVLLEQGVGPYLVSALADPDVGTGTFIVQITLLDGTAAPADTTISLWVQPEDGHLDAYGQEAEREVTRGEERFVARIPFDSEGQWQVRLELEGSAGPGEVSFGVRVTPPGPGWWATVACLVPFAGLGILWWIGSRRQEQPPASSQAEDKDRIDTDD